MLEVDRDVSEGRCCGFVDLPWIKIVVLMGQPVPQTGGQSNPAGKLSREHPQLGQFQERVEEVPRGDAARFERDVVVDI